MKMRLFTTFHGKATQLCRVTAALLVPVLFITAPSCLAEADSIAQQKPTTMHPTKVLTPKHVTVNRKLPKFKAPTQTVAFSTSPTDAEIFSKSLFAEPLIPISGTTTLAENQALTAALTTFEQRKVRDDFSSLENFLTANPKSPWQIALLMDLGWLYRQTGWYSKAMDTWQQAWTLGQAATGVSPQGKVIIDRALVELLVMDARVGRMDSLAGLIKTADARHITGSSKAKVESVKQALILMQTHPETSFRCGPMAVEKIRNIEDKNDPSKWNVKSDVSTQQGTSLAQLGKLASKLSLDMIPAFRIPGSAILVPSVVNWKVGHFAAAIGYEHGLVHLTDPTFNKDVWISPKALDAESSGYFLVKRQSLPTGWEEITKQQAAKVWGKGQVSGSDDTCNSDKDCKTCNAVSALEGGSPESSSYLPPNPFLLPFLNSVNAVSAAYNTAGMATASIHMMLASLSVEDTPLLYQPPYGPTINFHITYSQREASQPSIFTYSNMGPLWTFNWLSFITDDPMNQGAPVTQYLSDGGTLSYSGYNSSTKTYAPQVDTGGVLKITSVSSYELDLPDGSKQIFSTANNATPRNVFMTQSVDPQGNGLTFSYDGNYRLIAVKDALQQVTTVSYGSSLNIYEITQVTDPFGRSASFIYNPDGSLQSSTDVMGMVSSYSYQNDVLASMTTPYGTTTFDVGQDNSKRWVQITDPMGGKERVETWLDATGLITAPAAQDVPNGEDNNYVQYRNTFYWNKKAMMEAPGNYSQAQLIHWLEDPTFTTMQGQIESYKAPLENRIYYNYLNQPQSIVIGSSGQPTSFQRILDNGTTHVLQAFNATYTSVNKTTQLTSPPLTNNPNGRSTHNNYDPTNNVDLLSVTQQNQSNLDNIFSAQYNSQHEPLKITDSAGQVTNYSYYPNGETQSITDPKGEVKTNSYNGAGYLSGVTDVQTGATTSYTHDGFGRIRTMTDSNGYTLTYDYDSLNRITVVTFPDGTYDQNVYVSLNLSQRKDRLNRWTQYFYNANGELTGEEDAQGRVTSYDRCACGELLSITDSYGHRTSWTNDIQGRLMTKTFPDGSQYNYTYEPSTSRLLTFADANSQTATYSYNTDNTLSQVAYSGGSVSTPTVSFTYDPYYARVLNMNDGTGQTRYTYYPVGGIGGGQAATETSPIPNSGISYTYDQLGRLTTTSINGTASTLTFDSLNRIKTETDSALSSTAFNYNYVSSSPRLQTLTYPNGQSASYGYQSGPNQDFRLTDVTNYKTGTTILSKFDYTYNGDGTIASWEQQTDSNTPTIWNYQYDRADQLLSAVKTNTSTQAVLTQYVYTYDLAGNRTNEQIGLGVTTTAYSPLNEITGTTGGGPLQFTGALSKPAQVTVGGNPASINASNNNFSGTVNVPAGTSTVPIVANDYEGNSVTNKYQVVIPSSSAITAGYDGNGNLTNNGAGQAYVWDAKNELTAINYSGGAVVNGITQTQLTYDGDSRCVKIVEMAGGTVSSTKQFVWIGNRLAEERSSSGSVTKRFFAWGEQIGGISYYLTRDHLGSVRELTNGSGATQSRYDYDPFGVVNTVGTVSVPSDFQYAGMYEHPTSQLNLTQYRPFNPNAGRWLNRDPMGERIGLNLYAYVGNNPISFVDPLGLNPGDFLPSSAGVQVSGSVDGGTITPGGYAAAGGTVSWSLGVYHNTSSGQSTAGAAISAGGFVRVPGGPNGSLPTSGGLPGGTQCLFSVGGNAGVGPGVFFSNAGNVSDLNGPFNQYNLNLLGINIALGLSSSNGLTTYILGVSLPNAGLALSGYPTNTVSTNPNGKGTAPTPTGTTPTSSGTGTSPSGGGGSSSTSTGGSTGPSGGGGSSSSGGGTSD